MKHFYRAAALFLILGAFFYNQAVAGATISIWGQFRQALALPFLVVKDIILTHSLADRLSQLELEDQDLRAKILALNLGVKPPSGKLIPAKIFASYPFSNKSNIVIALGKNDGVEIGAVVLATPSIFLGQVSNAGSDWSEVRTLFDASHNMSVRIGGRGVPALLSGGVGITLGMIDKSRSLHPGEDVYAAARGIPYGLKVGTLGEIHEPSGGVFKEADLILPYSIGALEQVLVLSAR